MPELSWPLWDREMLVFHLLFVCLEREVLSGKMSLGFFLDVRHNNEKQIYRIVSELPLNVCHSDFSKDSSALLFSHLTSACFLQLPLQGPGEGTWGSRREKTFFLQTLNL